MAEERPPRLSDADLWDREFERWRARGDSDESAADRATNYVERRRRQTGGATRSFGGESEDLGIFTPFRPRPKRPAPRGADLIDRAAQRPDITRTTATREAPKPPPLDEQAPYRDPKAVAEVRGELQRIATGRKPTRPDGRPYSALEQAEAEVLDNNLRARIDREEAKGGFGRRFWNSVATGAVNAPLEREINEARDEGRVVTMDDLRALDVGTRTGKLLRTEPTTGEYLREEMGPTLLGEAPYYALGGVAAEARVLGAGARALSRGGVRRGLGEALERVAADEITATSTLGRAGQRATRGAIQGQAVGAALSAERGHREGRSASDIAQNLPLELAIGGVAGAVLDPLMGAGFDVARGAARRGARVFTPDLDIDLDAAMAEGTGAGERPPVTRRLQHPGLELGSEENVRGLLFAAKAMESVDPTEAMRIRNEVYLRTGQIDPGAWQTGEHRIGEDPGDVLDRVVRRINQESESVRRLRALEPEEREDILREHTDREMRVTGEHPVRESRVKIEDIDRDELIARELKEPPRQGDLIDRMIGQIDEERRTRRVTDADEEEAAWARTTTENRILSAREIGLDDTAAKDAALTPWQRLNPRMKELLRPLLDRRQARRIAKTEAETAKIRERTTEIEAEGAKHRETVRAKQADLHAENRWQSMSPQERVAFAQKAGLHETSVDGGLHAQWRTLNPRVKELVKPLLVGTAAAMVAPEGEEGTALASTALVTTGGRRIATRALARMDEALAGAAAGAVAAGTPFSVANWVDILRPSLRSEKEVDLVRQALRGAVPPESPEIGLGVVDDAILTGDTVRGVLSGIEDPSRQPEPGRGFFHSRLRNAVKALPKAWDAPRPAADWIGKLTGSEASKFSKQELALIRPILDNAAKTKGAKIDRETMLALIDDHAPEIEMVTLAKDDTAKPPLERETDDEWDFEAIEGVEQAATDPAAHFQWPRNELLGYLEAQYALRGEAAAEFREKIEADQARLSDEVDEASRTMERRERELRDTIEGAGLPARYADPAINYLDEHVEAEYVPRDAVDKAFEEISDNLYEADKSIDEDGMEDLLYQNNYRVDEEDEAPQRRVRSRFTPIESGGRMRSDFDFIFSKDKTEEEHREAARRTWGDEAAENLEVYEHPTRRWAVVSADIQGLPGRFSDSWELKQDHSFDAVLKQAEDKLYNRTYQRLSDSGREELRRGLTIEEREPPTVYTVRHDQTEEVVAMDRDREQAMKTALEVKGLWEEPVDFDEFLGSVKRDLSDYADARADWSRAESEHYHATEDEGEAYSDWHDEITRNDEEAELIEGWIEAEREARAADPTLAGFFPDTAPGTTPAELALMAGEAEPQPGAVPVVDLAAQTVTPTVKGDPKYSSYQRIPGGKKYRELLNIWLNNPGTQYDKNHYGTQFPNTAGHARVEEHEIVNAPGITDVPVLQHVEGESVEAKNLKDFLNQARKERDTILDQMTQIAREYEALPAERRDPHNPSPEALKLANDYKLLNERAIEKANYAVQIERDLVGEMGVTSNPETVAVMLESQSDWAQDAGREGVVQPEAHENAAKLAELERSRQGMTQRLRAVETALNDNLRDLRSEYQRDHNPWLAQFYDEYKAANDGENFPTTSEINNPNWQTNWRWLEEHAHAAGFADLPERIQRLREVRAESDALDNSIVQAREQFSESMQGVPPTPFIVGGDKIVRTVKDSYGDKRNVWNAEGAAAFVLNAARFLIDSAERNISRIAWSTGANRVKNAHLPLLAAKSVYDEITPAAMKRLLGALGFKDVKIDRTFIRGEGHWSLELTPEMRRAIRTVGLPTLGLLAATLVPDDLSAQTGEDGDEKRRASDTAMLGAGALAAGVFGARVWQRGLAAALKDLGSRGKLTNPLALAALGAAMQSVPDEEFDDYGKGVVAMAALKSIGSKAMGRAGGAVGRTIVDAAKAWGAEGVIRQFTPDALLSPEVRKALQRFRDDVAKGKAQKAEQVKKLTSKGAVVNRAVTDVMRGENWEGPLTPDDAQAALTLAASLLPQTTEMTDTKLAEGLITPEQAAASGGGAYLPRIYAEFEAERANPAMAGRPDRGEGRPLRISEQKSRTLDDLPPDERDEIRRGLGEFRESSFLAGVALEKGWRDIGVSRLLSFLRSTPDALHPEWLAAYDDVALGKQMRAQATTPTDKLVAQQLIDDARATLREVSRKFETKGDYVKLSDSEGLGDLAGAVVQRDIAHELQGMPDLPGISAFWRFWKQMKTVANPGTHIANTVGNGVMLHMAGLPLTQQPEWLTKAVGDMADYGDATRYLSEHGDLNTIPLDTSMPHRVGGEDAYKALLELRRETAPHTADVLYERGIRSAGEKLADRGHSTMGDLLDRTQEAIRATDEVVGVQKVSKDAQTLYQNEDNVFRVAAFLWQKSLGKTDAEAREFAKEELINFHTRSPLLHYVRNTVAPFALFPAKALPKFAKHLVDHPERWIMLTMALLALNEAGEEVSGYDFEAGDIPERDRTSGFGPLLPELIQLPTERDERGGVAALDFMRWTPGSAVTQGVPEHSVAGRLGLPTLFQPSGPAMDLLSVAATSRDPFTGRPITSERGMAAVPDYLGFAMREMMPTAASLHAPRVLEDLEKENYPKASTDALAFGGVRPRYFQPREGARRAQTEFDDYIRGVDRELRRDLRESNNPEYRREQREEAKEKRARARLRLREQKTARP